MKTRLIWLAALVLLTALSISGTVFAQSEEPPALPEGQPTLVEPVVVVEEPPTTEEVAPVELIVETPVVEVVLTEEALLPAEEPQPLVEAPGVETAALVDEPQVVLMDPAGEPMDMASQESAQVLAVADPYFKVGLKYYRFLTDCSSYPASPTNECIETSVPSIQEAIDYIRLNGTVPTDGKIYAENATYTENISIDGSLPYLASFKGLIGIADAGVFPTISGDVNVNNLISGFTLSGFTIDGDVYIYDNSGALVLQDLEVGGHSISATQSGNITVKNVKTHNSGSFGTALNNPSAGNVVISDSEFNNNIVGDGLKIETNGTVTINNVISSDNGYYGIALSGSKSVTLKNVIANYNMSNTGIKIESHSGSLTMENITANDNGSFGVHANLEGMPVTVIMKNMTANNNDGGGIYIETLGAVTITNSATFSNTNGRGLFISTKGAVKLTTVGAGNNGAAGVKIEGVFAYDGSDRKISMASPASVTITSPATAIFANFFGNNGQLDNPALGRQGILIITENSVSINNFNAGNNLGYGVNITGPLLYDSILDANVQHSAGAVTITSTILNWRNYIGNNQMDGINVYSAKAVTLAKIDMDNNTGNGVYIRTMGAISLTGISSTRNGLSGVDLDNCLYNESSSLCLGTGSITISSPSGTLNNFDENNHFGVWVVSKGAITVTNIRANTNGSDGAFLWNHRGGSSAAITVATSGAVRNEFNGNGKNSGFAPWYPDGGVYYWVRFNGLTALSGGNISIKNSSACSNNFGWGAGIVALNNEAATAKTVVIADSETSGNDQGLVVYSKGSITLTNVYAFSNGGYGGIWLDNCLESPPDTRNCLGSGTIKLTNVTANDNSGTGLSALSKGVITIVGANANNNWNFGIELRNSYIDTTAGINLANITADNNNNTGITVTTNGSAVLKTINTHNNARTHGGIGEGQTVQDFFNQSLGPDSWWFSAEDVSEGKTYSLKLMADAGWALNRAGFDPWMELYDPDTDEKISLTPSCTPNVSCEFSFEPFDFSYTEAHTFYVLVGSSTFDGFYRLSLDDTHPSDSTEMIWAEGTGISAGGSISVSNIESHNNSLTGLAATTMGNNAITLSNLHISSNGSEGVYLTCGQDPNDFNISGFGTGTITISGDSYTNQNGWDGLSLGTSGVVTIKQLDAYYNGRDTNSPGVKFRENGAAKVVTLSNITANENGGGGLWVQATNNITLTNVQASNNQWGFSGVGIYVDNCLDSMTPGTCSANGTIKLTTISANDNQGKGLYALSNGAITLAGGVFNNNSDVGAHLTNQFVGTIAGITFKNVDSYNNGNNGILTETNGALTMTTINASGNAKVEGKLDSGSTVQDFYNQGKGPDRWWFNAETGTEYTLLMQADGYGTPGLLNRFTFDPFLKLYNQAGDEIVIAGGDIAHTIDTLYQLTFTPGSGEGGWYYLEASSTTNNGFYRLSVNDPSPDDSTSWFFVNGLAYEAGGNVTLSGLNIFNDNADAGVIGSSKGNVTLSNIGTWGNGAEGVYIDNLGGSGNVTLTGSNVSSASGWEGLRVDTNGTVSVSNLETSYNGQGGVRISANTLGKSVTLLNVTSMFNNLEATSLFYDLNGISIDSHGTTTLNNVRSWMNKDDGANIDTHGYNLVTLNSTFMSNGNYGLAYTGYSLPFIFTNINNAYLGNGNTNLKVLP
jgi:putative surface-exposed virulence protein